MDEMLRPYISCEELISRIQKYHPEDDMDLVSRAYDYAEKAHEGQVRKSGAPYFSHPVAVAVILSVISIFNNFNAIWLMTQGGPLYSTEIMYTYAYRRAFVDHKFGYAAASSVIIFIVIAILTTIYIKMISAKKEG